MSAAERVASGLPGGGRTVRDRRRLLAGVIGVVVLAAVGGWVAGSRISSPAEIAARTAAPLASPILVPVEERVLSTDVVTRGTARFGSPQQISLAPSALKSAVGVPGRLPVSGTELREGDIVFTASGRPVFLLVGAQPVYRDLGPGIEGQDVRQLEEALERLGFDAGPVDGVYDALTERAVSAWYRRAGFAPFTASTEQLAELRALERERTSTQLDEITASEAVSTAQAVRDAAWSALARATEASGRAALAVSAAEARASAADDAATREVAAKQTLLRALLASPSVIPASSAEIAAAEANLAAAEANAVLTRIAGEQAVANAAPEDVADEQAKADAANAAAAAEVAAMQAALDALRAGTPGIPATAAEIAAARADLAAAEANQTATHAAGERETAEAELAAALAQADLTAASDSVRATEAVLEHAFAALELRQSQADAAGSELRLARLRAGVQLPADEVVFVASAPVRVAEPAAANDQAAGPRVTVTNAVVAVDGSLRLEEAPLVKSGMRVVIDEADLGIKATGVVSRVADSPGSNGVDGFHVYFEVLVDGAPATLVGASVRLTVPIESTSAGVLAVPVSALTLSADGSSRVQRKSDDALEFITVEPGLSANGFVAVTPIDGALAKGDLVVVGFSAQGTSPK